MTMLAMVAVAPAAADDAPPLTPELEAFFETDIRPVLAANCVPCHGPNLQMGNLRLDSRDALLAGGARGPSVVLGDPEASLLIQAVHHDGLQMPPAAKLPDEQITALTEWVRLHAPWPGEGETAAAMQAAGGWRDHWSFKPIADPEPPAVADDAWVRSPIDRFVLHRLEAEGLAPAPEADRATLIRRAYHVLLGLPPSFEQVQAFVSDPAPTDEALARLVDDLLARPQYGERWARHWLDIARYSDTKGYVFQEERLYPYAYTYRDWVIQALNDDLPYDRFVTYQLAADRLQAKDPEFDRKHLAAMGFLTVGRRFLNNPHDIIDDRIDVTTRGFMGLTVSCARCHDHKYDPIPTADYYSLYGVFAGSHEPGDLPLLGEPADTEAYRAFVAELHRREQAVQDWLVENHAKRTGELRAATADYLKAVADIRRGGEVDAVRGARKLNAHGLNRWMAYLNDPARRPESIWAPFDAFVAVEGDFAAGARAYVEQIRADETARAALHPAIWALFAEAPPESLEQVAERYATLLLEADAAWQAALADNAALEALPDAEREALRRELSGADAPPAVPFEEHRALFVGEDTGRFNELRRQVDNLQATHPGAPPRAMVLVDNDQPVEPVIFDRGNPGRPGEQVPRQFPMVVAGDDRQPFTDGSGRLELAQAIVSEHNPLTARVIVNRVWMHQFGRPLVDTPSDFGTRSDPPTHPELLDWLARDFIAHGWSLKHLHRRILLSSTWRQSSDGDPAVVEADPENRLLARQNRRRMDFEALRDALLWAAGQLDTQTFGGRPVDITAAPYPNRRTVYAFIERQNLPGVFRTFDFAGPDFHSPRRAETTVPQQALYLLNHPFAIEQARTLAATVAEPDLAQRVSAVHRRLFGRDATADELALAERFLAQAEAHPNQLEAQHDAAWSYGYGHFDADTGALESFTPLPHFTGQAWQGGPELPDGALGWATLNAGGGHPGQAAFAVVRRWTAPYAATIHVRGALNNPSEEGDGVRGSLLHSRTGRVAEWTVDGGATETTVESLTVEPGDHLDFVVDCQANESHDSFGWAPRLQVVAGEPPMGGARLAWNAEADFGGPLPDPPAPLTPWEQYVQVLLMTNAFAFVD